MLFCWTTTWVAGATVGAAPPLYRAATFDVANATNLVYAQGLACKDQLNNETCTPMDLKLDAYMPRRRSAAGSVDVPALKPAYILAHGGGNSGGAKEQYCFQGSAAFFAARGFVAFNIDYRLKVRLLHPLAARRSLAVTRTFSSTSTHSRPRSSSTLFVPTHSSRATTGCSRLAPPRHRRRQGTSS